jgi:hypothetical protein
MNSMGPIFGRRLILGEDLERTLILLSFVNLGARTNLHTCHSREIVDEMLPNTHSAALKVLALELEGDGELV